MRSVEMNEMMRSLAHVTMFILYIMSQNHKKFSDLMQLQYAWFHVIFIIGAMYVAMLLTDWCA